ncbi:hypothetical protein [Pseudomonas fluorescens]|uniref:Lipoprotein n=1 Tax=Pseudomonas fluorescens TaxID=294 RepID=A0A5E7ERP9_PSEFL|nr:hypothetical protein [Pseudomonas fluorescens]VVO29499.1 hypothetical protein PS691_04825 [Pseudomonas fluorescens]
MTLFKFGACILVLTVFGCGTTGSHEPPPVPPSAVTLDDGQARTALVGTRFYGNTRSGHPYSISFFADGTDVFVMPPDAPVTERWALNSGVICIEMKKYPTECSQVKVANNQYWFVDPANGKVNAHLKLTP